MKGIDTNILIRFLTGDDKSQAQKVYRIFKQTESNKEELFVPAVVVLELVWVLESVYEISREDILESLSDLLLMPILKFENQSIIQEFFHAARNNNYDLSDLLIAHCAGGNDCRQTLTFDKKASRYSLFELVE